MRCHRIEVRALFILTLSGITYLLQKFNSIIIKLSFNFHQIRIIRSFPRSLAALRPFTITWNDLTHICIVLFIILFIYLILSHFLFFYHMHSFKLRKTVVLTYFFFQRSFSHWKIRGVQFIRGGVNVFIHIFNVLLIDYLFIYVLSIDYIFIYKYYFHLLMFGIPYYLSRRRIFIPLESARHLSPGINPEWSRRSSRHLYLCTF